METLPNLRKTLLEPKVFCMVATSLHGQILYMGVHFSLEEAYSAARMKMEGLAPHRPTDAVDIGLWNMMSAREALAKFVDPIIVPIMTPVTQDTAKAEVKPEEHHPESLQDYVEDMRLAKNDLMKKLIEDGDPDKVEEATSLLGANSKRYVLKSIKDKNKQSTVDNSPDSSKIK